MAEKSNDNEIHGLAGLGPDVFRRLADASAEGIGMARLDSQIIYANATLRRLLGLTDASVLTEHSFYDYFLPAEAVRLRDEIIPQVQSTNEWTGELELVSGSGTVWQTIQNIFLIRDGHGTPVAFANVITDITEYMRATESLRVNQTAIDSAINAIAMSSLEGRLTYVNQAFVDLWRLDSVDDALGRSPLEFWEQPQQAQAVVAALQQVGHWQGEMLALRHDGSTAELALSAHLVRNETGQPLCMMSSFLDVSARKYAERELLRSEALLNNVIQQIPAMVFLKRASDLRFEMFNYAGEELLGLEQTALLGKSDHDFFPPEQAGGFAAKDREVLDSGLPLDIPQETIRARNGEPRILHTRKIGIYDDAGKPTHLLGISLDITEQKLAEAALKQQRDFATSLVNTAPVIILLLDTQGMIQHVNPYFEKLTGYWLDEIKGKEWFSTLLPEQDRDRIRRLFRSATHDTPTRGNINAIVTRSGEEREIEWNDQILRDAEGAVTGLLAIGLDVTGKRRLEAELRRAYGENQAITQAIHDNLYMLDESGQLTWWNRQVEEVTGLAPEVLKGMPGVEFFVDEDREVVGQAIGEAFSEGYGEVEARMITRNGPVWHHYNGVRVHDEQGNVIGIAGVGRDITDRLQALEAVQRSERELKALNESLEARVLERTAEVQQQSLRSETILRTTIDGFWAADLTGRLHDANPAFCAMLGYSKAELLQMSIADFEANESPADVAAHIEKILSQGQDRFDTRHRRKDGSLVEIEVSVSLVELGGEKMFYVFTRDIMARKAMQAALVRAREEAERANAAKSEFLSRMSHELRTPLNAILGFGQLLETDPVHPLTATQIDNVREIRHAGDHLLQMVNEVLDLSRIESGRLDLSLEPVSIVSVIKACLAQIQPLAAQRGIRVAMELDAPCAVQADRTRLKGVLLNLLSNAVKYNREGGSIQIDCVPVGVAHLRISVRDSGRGIAADALPRLFKPFERMESAYDGIEGTGIGLALSKKLVEAMHGEIGVETVAGEGSTFWFELPMADGDETLTAPAAPPVVASIAGGGIRRKVLYIEDNPANLLLVQKIIATRKDIELLDAGSAEAGLDIAVNQRPSLILLDINLPGMDGFEALHRLREHPVTRDIPVVAVTANAMVRDIERGKAAGFTDYLTKPIDISRFFSMLDRCLSGSTENEA